MTAHNSPEKFRSNLWKLCAIRLRFWMHFFGAALFLSINLITGWAADHSLNGTLMGLGALLVVVTIIFKRRLP